MYGMSFGGSIVVRLGAGRDRQVLLFGLVAARLLRTVFGVVCILALGVGVAPAGDKPTPAPSPTATVLEPLSEEIGSEEEKPEPELAKDTTVTLDHLREFWKRESLPHVQEFYFQPFRVPPRKGELSFYPCLDCHEDNSINNPHERTLTEEHTSIKLQHGANRFWCPTCHNLKDMNDLRSLKDHKIDFNRSYLVCGQCHFQRQKDWFAGGHGKRIGTWTEPRVIVLCVECHNPHSPSIKPKRPEPPPERHESPRGLLVQVLDFLYR